MTNKRLALPETPLDQLVIETTHEAQVIFGANSRYGTSWFKGAEAAERSIDIANKLKVFMEEFNKGLVPMPLIFMEEDRDYLLENLEAAAADVKRPNRQAAKHLLDTIVYVDVGLPSLMDASHLAAVEQADLGLAA